jgi:HAD superfamily hydrolase (TIGR01509 family)
MKFKAVIFDLDGTLIDSMGLWAQVDRDFLGKRNIPVPDDLFDDIQVGNSYVEVAEHFKKKFSLPDSVESIMNEWTEMVAWHYQNDIPLKSGAKEFLTFLHENGIKIGVGTSNIHHLTEIVLSAHNVWHYVEAVVDGQENLRGKPMPDIFLRVAEKLGVLPEECLVIEDVFAGVMAAKNAGMTAFAIEDDYSIKDKEDIKINVDFYAQDFHEIKERLTSSE